MVRVHSTIPNSKTNGPGNRFVIWFQGCILNCEGCFNENLQPSKGGTLCSIDSLIEQIYRTKNINGVSISGGEPFQQPNSLLKLLKKIKSETSYSIVLFSGYTLEEIKKISSQSLSYIDILISGRFKKDYISLHPLKGSENQKIYFLSDRYKEKDLEDIPDKEFIIKPNGEIIISGIR